MLLAVLAPEYILYFSTQKFFKARDLPKYLAAQGKSEWTFTHLQFMCANGFQLQRPERERLRLFSKGNIRRSTDRPGRSKEKYGARRRYSVSQRIRYWTVL